MKIPTLVVVSLLACASALAKAPVQQPVENDVKFTGEYIFAQHADEVPRARKPLKIDYPQKMRGADQDGSALVVFIVNTKGRPEEIQVAKASDASFGEAAVEAVKKLSFTPAKKDGKAVRAVLSLPVNFRLEHH